MSNKLFFLKKKKKKSKRFGGGLAGTTSRPLDLRVAVQPPPALGGGYSQTPYFILIFQVFKLIIK
jgi:hypothetical protein